MGIRFDLLKSLTTSPATFSAGRPLPCNRRNRLTIWQTGFCPNCTSTGYLSARCGKCRRGATKGFLLSRPPNFVKPNSTD